MLRVVKATCEIPLTSTIGMRSLLILVKAQGLAKLAVISQKYVRITFSIRSRFRSLFFPGTSDEHSPDMGHKIRRSRPGWQESYPCNQGRVPSSRKSCVPTRQWHHEHQPGPRRFVECGRTCV